MPNLVEGPRNLFPTRRGRAALSRRLSRARDRRAHYYHCRDKLLEGGQEALAGKDEGQSERELRKKVRELERALGRKTYDLEIAWEALRGWE